jgi:hypothetical protein
MNRPAFALLLAAVLSTVLFGEAPAAFAFSPAWGDGAAIGRGGAVVAAGAGYSAVLANPAALGAGKTVELALPAVSFRADDQIGVQDALDDIDALLGDSGDLLTWAAGASSADRQALVDILVGLDRPGRNGVDFSAGGVAGVGFSAWGYGIGIGYADFLSMSVIADIDGDHLNPDPGLDFVGLNQSRMQVRGIEGRGPVLTISKQLGGVALGVNLRQVSATAYAGSLSAFSGSTGEDDLNDAMKESKKESSATAFDVGAQTDFILPGLRVGLAVRDLNAPEYDLPGGGKWTAAPQWRAGARWDLPVVDLSADLDLNPRESFTPGVKYREAALGAEADLWLLRLRAGLSRNMAIPGSPTLIHYGVGLHLLALDLDLGGATDSDNRHMQAAFNLALRF